MPQTANTVFILTIVIWRAIRRGMIKNSIECWLNIEESCPCTRVIVVEAGRALLQYAVPAGALLGHVGGYWIVKVVRDAPKSWKLESAESSQAGTDNTYEEHLEIRNSLRQPTRADSRS